MSVSNQQNKVTTARMIFLCLIVLLIASKSTYAQYQLKFILVDAGQKAEFTQLNPVEDFKDRRSAFDYLKKFSLRAQIKGYAAASVDSTSEKESSAEIYFYLGKKYNYAGLEWPTEFDAFFRSARSYPNYNLINLNAEIDKLLEILENTGYPFAVVRLDSMRFLDDGIHAKIVIDRGIRYKIDSIRLHGNLKIKKKVLNQILDIYDGDAYSQKKIALADQKISMLPYCSMIQPSSLQWLGSGAVLDVFLNSQNNSRFNFILGLQPSPVANNKLNLTGDVDLQLSNFFLNGETVIVKWQQLQYRSPRLQLAYAQPFLHKGVGMDLRFELFKKDSSFLQINARAGTRLNHRTSGSAHVFVWWQQSRLMEAGIDTNRIKSEKRLPPNIGMLATGIGMGYEQKKTDNPRNPQKGTDWNFVLSLGRKKIQESTTILNLKSPDFDYSKLYDTVKSATYQFRFESRLAHYFKTGSHTTIKGAIQYATLLTPRYFRNELFQIGGFRTIRGFDEENFFASSYGVLTAEFRLLFNRNAHLSFFTEGGFYKNRMISNGYRNTLVSTGAGLQFDTKAGVLNFVFAIGKRSDLKFDLRSASRVHFGYINYF